MIGGDPLGLVKSWEVSFGACSQAGSLFSPFSVTPSNTLFKSYIGLSPFSYYSCWVEPCSSSKFPSKAEILKVLCASVADGAGFPGILWGINSSIGQGQLKE